jgi:NAD(P)-dependent dehydrogenase (short-subunit alcohol dehydrogenase family)
MSAFTAAFLALLAMAPLTGLAQAPAPGPKAILVTGASTGIGRSVTERLAADGYFVYAGARKAADLKALGAIKNVEAVRLDVTRPEDINAAVETVRKGGRGLYGLVNNAGVGTIGTVADLKPEEFELVMAVNVYGPYRMTRAFESLITAEKGRIVNMGSIAGIGTAPQLTVYSMSKRALEAFTDSLAEELEPSGVSVSIIEPGDYNSDIAKNAIQRLGGDPRLGDRSKYKDPAEVAVAVEQALFEPKPKRRYMVVPDADEAQWTVSQDIAQLVELNEGQPYTYDRAALLKMLDAALAKSRPRTP